MIDILEDTSKTYSTTLQITTSASDKKYLKEKMTKYCEKIKLSFDKIHQSTLDLIEQSQPKDTKTQLDEHYARSIVKKHADQMDCKDTKDIIEKFVQIFTEIPNEFLIKQSPDFDIVRIKDFINQYEEAKSNPSPLAKMSLNLFDYVLSEACKSLQSEIQSYYNDEL